jgi:predicted metal-dependent enzyme (double-stranded beta helix superfamily)
MKNFSIDGFAKDCKDAMEASEDRHEAARAFLEATLRDNTPEQIIEVLEAAIPADADIGEMIVHASPELTMLYARVPARFRSGVHNHTVFACIGQLTGSEVNTVYQREGDTLTFDHSATVQAGEVLPLPADAIHNIENPTDAVAASLHIYGGDFGAVMDERSLWSSDDFKEKAFSFPALLKESVAAMKKDQNEAGLEALAEAIPAARALVNG